MAADPLAMAVVLDGSAASLAAPDDGSPEAPFLVDSVAGKVDGWSAPLAPLDDSAQRDCWVPAAAAAVDSLVPKTVADRRVMVAELGDLVRPESVPSDLALVALGFGDLVLADNSAQSMAAAQTVPAAELAGYGCWVRADFPVVDFRFEPSHFPVLPVDSSLSREWPVCQGEPASPPAPRAGLWYVVWPILAEPAGHPAVARESAGVPRMMAAPAVASTWQSQVD